MKKFIFGFVLILGLFSFGFYDVLAVSNAGLTQSANGTSFCNKDVSNLEGLLGWFHCMLVKALIPLLMGVATFSFIYGVFKFFLNPENVSKQADGKKYITWGLVGLFLMVSMWGIVGVFTNTFDIQSTIPQIKEQGS